MFLRDVSRGGDILVNVIDVSRTIRDKDEAKCVTQGNCVAGVNLCTLE